MQAVRYSVLFWCGRSPSVRCGEAESLVRGLEGRCSVCVQVWEWGRERVANERPAREASETGWSAATVCHCLPLPATARHLDGKE